MTMTTMTTTTDRAPRFTDSPTFGIDLSGTSAALRADSKRATMRPGPAPRR